MSQGENRPRITEAGEVLFKVRHQELKRAIREIKAGCKGAAGSISVHVLVSQFGLSIRSASAASECPADGIQPGTFRAPIKALEDLLKMQTGKEIGIHVREGQMKSGTSSKKHPEIFLSEIPDLRVSVPIDASVFDLLVIGRFLDERELKMQGLKGRVAEARLKLQEDLLHALVILSPYRVKREDLLSLIERIQTDAEPATKKAVYS